MLTIDKAHIFDHLIEKHVTEAAFLWLLRSQAVVQPHHTTASIYKLEQRINRHLDALSLNPDSAWKFALEAAAFNESGELFILALLALMSGDTQKINIAIEQGMHNQETFKGLVSALGWAPEAYVNPMLKNWLECEDFSRKHLAIATCSVRRLDPQLLLNRLFSDPKNADNFPLLSRMLRLTGELKRRDLISQLNAFQHHKNSEVMFWAHWSALMLGDHSVLPNFDPYVLQPGPLQTNAISVALRCMDQTQSWACINKLASQPGQTAQTMLALTTLGDPHCVNWLLARMEEPIHARMAGHAFSNLVGVDLTGKGLIQPHSPLADDDMNMDDNEPPGFTGYENLPIPDVEKVSQYWQAIRHGFSAGHRYFLGQPISADTVRQTIYQGTQSQRLSAALEFALMDRDHAYPNVKSTLHHWGGQ